MIGRHHSKAQKSLGGSSFSRTSSKLVSLSITNDRSIAHNGYIIRYAKTRLHDSIIITDSHFLFSNCNTLEKPLQDGLAFQ
jgi:hypothetical protein